MQLLREDEVRPEPGERVFRHGVSGPLALWFVLVAPLAFAVAMGAELVRVARDLPGIVWVALAPVLLFGGLLYLVCLHATGQVVLRALSPGNWLVRVSPAGLAIKLRSYQNAHFPRDVPTVARFAWSELARARKVTEVLESIPREGSVRRAWIELELRGSDAAELARALREERERPAPEGSFLGVKGRTRFGHVPVFVARAGVVRIEWLGRAALRALEAYLPIEEPRALDLARGHATLDARLTVLCARGERMEAIAIVRHELGLSLTDARAHVERLAHAAA